MNGTRWLALTFLVALELAQASGTHAAPSAPSASPVPAGSFVLYDQMDDPAEQSIISKDYLPIADDHDCQAADDFVVPAGEIWSVTGVDVAGVLLAGQGPPASFNVYFYANGADNRPGGLLSQRLAQPYAGGLADGDTVFIALDSPVSLTAGVRWVSVQGVSNAAADNWYWLDRATQSNRLAAWRNPGNGFGTGCTAWGDRNVCLPGGPPPDQLFRLRSTPPGGGDRNGIYHSAPSSHDVPADSSGTSLNLVSEAFDDAGPLNGDHDLNLWKGPGGDLAFWGIDTWDAHVLVDGSGKAAALRAGDTIGATAAFSSAGSIAPAAEWLAGTEAWLGLVFNCDGRLTNPVAGGVCYGYVHLRSSGAQGFPADVLGHAYDGDGEPLVIPFADRVFCSGFETAACAGSANGIFTTRAQFVERLAPGWFDNPFDDVGAGASPPLEYAQGGFAYTVDTQPGAAGTLYNAAGVISTANQADSIVVTFTGTPVTAVGGNFWVTDASFEPTGTEVVLYLADGTTHRYPSAGSTDFRGYVGRVPIDSIRIDAPPAGPIATFITLDNLVIGVGN